MPHPRPQIRIVDTILNPTTEQLLTPHPRSQIRVVDTILNPTTRAASPTPSSTATDPLHPHRSPPYRSRSTNTLLDGSRSPYRTPTASAASSPLTFLNLIPTVWQDAKHPSRPRYLSPLNPSSITCPMYFKYTNRSLLPVMQLAKTTRTMYLLDLTAWPTKILD